MRAKSPQRYGCEDYGFDYNINGAIGEMMLAKHLNLYWAGAIGNKKAPDVSRYYQVRGTCRRDGRLIVHPPDEDHLPFVLARVLLPEVHLVGWQYGRLAKVLAGNMTGPRPAYFVETADLEDMKTLPTESELAAMFERAKVARAPSSTCASILGRVCAPHEPRVPQE